MEADRVEGVTNAEEAAERAALVARSALPRLVIVEGMRVLELRYQPADQRGRGDG